MRWPWRHRNNGEAAKQAKADAKDQLREAEEQAPRVDNTVRAAQDLARSANRFIRESQRSMHIRRGSA
jgi:hypothetical protein